MTNNSITVCPVCNSKEFLHVDVLWQELIRAWQLSETETAYINRQQGFHCTGCRNNLRAMGLAAAILREYKFNGSLQDFIAQSVDLDILEINQAGSLTPELEKYSKHRLIEYPEFDMHDLAIASQSYDLVIHSDTLEHVENPARALSECRRVLRDNGVCIFTVPIVVDRMNRSRFGLEPSYHGQSGVPANDQIVFTEFGVDAWKSVLMAGFASCEIFSFEYPSALVLIARN